MKITHCIVKPDPTSFTDAIGVRRQHAVIVSRHGSEQTAARAMPRAGYARHWLVLPVIYRRDNLVAEAVGHFAVIYDGDPRDCTPDCPSSDHLHARRAY